MSMEITQIRRILGETTYAAGEALVEAGQVRETRELQSGQVVTGLVEDGGRRRIYIHLSADELDGECSCDRGENCDHVAAVLIQVRRNQGPSAISRSVDSRVGIAATSSEPGRYAPGQQRLHYRLEVVDSPDSCLERAAHFNLSLWVGQPGGGWSAFVPQTVRSSQYPRYVQPQDREILAQLLNLSVEGPYPLQGEAGARLLKACVETQRCHCGELDAQPLHTGKSLVAQPRWVVRRDGRQALDLQLPLKVQFSPTTRPALYLDKDVHHLGELEFVGDSDAVLSLVDCEPLSPEAVPAFNRTHAPAVPAAKALTVISASLESINARLELFAKDDRPWAKLYFIYNGQSIDSDRLTSEQGSLRYMQAGQLFEVERDLQQEARLRHQLNDFSHAEHGLSLPGKRAWLTFMLLGREALLRAGWELRIHDKFPYRLAQARDWYGELTADSLPEGADARQDWFSLELGIMVDGEPVNILPLLIQQLRHCTMTTDTCADGDKQQIGDQLLLQLGDGRYLPVPLQRVQKILETLVELYDRDCLDADGCLHLPANQASRLAQLQREAFGEEDESLAWTGDEALQELADRFRDFDGILPLSPPTEFRAELRDYQREGLGWLQFLRQYGVGGILADDMGLGKTVQTLAHLTLEKAAGRLRQPCLIIAPTSLMGNWRNEAARFAPDLKLLTLHGPKRHAQFSQMAEADIVLTSYPLLNFDGEQLLALEYTYLILDEAQTIKNPRAKASRLVRELVAEHRLCLTGTPMENHLGELWSLFDFLQPGLLGDERYFQRVFRTPIEREGNRERGQGLARRIAPFVLRRTKELVATELPAKTEIVRSVPLDEKQRDLYDSIRLSMHEQIRQVIKEQGFARSHIAVLDALLKLRQVCCDPRLLDLDTAGGVTESAKFDTLIQMLPELVEEGRRILVFSQFTSMLALIETALRELGIACVKLTGQTRDRAAVVAQFQRGDTPVFLISLKAGGTGLNLTAADTVIHYDPWWNPAAENQATDRAYRIGQDKPVFVYKLVTEGTVEEKILRLQQRKQALAEGLYGGKSGSPTRLTQEDLEALLEPVTEAISETSAAGAD